MKKGIIFSLVCILSGFLLVACQRARSVFAGNDSDSYEPRPAPARPAPAAKSQVQNPPTEIKGELLRVDIAGKTISVRVENGMEQTFRFDDNTTVTGLPDAASKSDSNAVGSLAGKEGSELTVTWHDENEAKIANQIEVTQVITAKATKHTRRK